MFIIQATHTRRRYSQEQCLDTKIMLHDATQWGDHKTIRRVYGRNYEREAREIIRDKVQ